MTTDQNTTTTARPARTRLLAGLGIAAALTAATVTGAGIAAAGDHPTDHSSQIVEDSVTPDDMTWDADAGAWVVQDSVTQVIEDGDTQVVEDTLTPVAQDPAGTPDQEFNQQTGLTWNEQAGTWMFADTLTDTGSGSDTGNL